MEKKKVKIEYYIFYAFGAMLFLLYCWHTIICYDTTAEANIITAVIEGMDRLVKKPFDIRMTEHFKQGMSYGFLICFLAYVYIFFLKKKTMFGKEYGQARWATDQEAKRLADPENEDRNMILTNDVFISMNTRFTFLNNNILVIGGSGSGKTRYFAKPNMLQLSCSYVITDPKGENLKSTGTMFKENGYEIKVLNLIERDHSDCYNPMVYIHKPSDAYKLTNQIVKNTNPEGKMGVGSDPFWEKAEIMLLYALILYMWMELEKEAVNFKTLMDLIGKADASEEDENAMSDLDYIFDNLEEAKGKTYLPCAIYRDYKKAAGKTAKSILVSVAARMNPFRMPDVQDLTLTDTMELDQVGNRKTALFIITSDSDMTFNFMASILYSQLFNELYFVADFGKLGWQNNKILFRTPQGLHKKQKEIKALFEKYDRAIADNRKRKIYKKIRSIIIECKSEFGLPYKDLPMWDDQRGEAVYTDEKNNEMSLEEYLDEYVDAMESCLLRLKNRKHTLTTYLDEYIKERDTVKQFKGNDKKEVIAALEESTKKMKVIEERIKNEFGIYKHMPEPPRKRLFAANKYEQDLKEYRAECKKAEQFYIEDIKYLLIELNSKAYIYGSRESFEDKLEKIKKQNKHIKKLQQNMSELSKRQKTEKKRFQKQIAECQRKAKRLEDLFEYEFGVKNIGTFKRNGGRLPIHVRCILDEFANITPIPDFAKLTATMRSREISVSIILQNISQLKEMYKDNWESISGNCDSFLFLGGQEQGTLKYVSEQLGKATIDKRSTGTSKGHQGSSSQNWDVLGRELMTQDELRTMKGTECILFVRGYFPFRSEKYELTKHKRYKLLSESDNDPRAYMPEKMINTKESAKGIAKNSIMNDLGIFEIEVQKETKRLIDYIETNKRTVTGDIDLSLFDSDNIIISSNPNIVEAANNSISELYTKRILEGLSSQRINLQQMTLDELEAEYQEMIEEISTGTEIDADINKNAWMYENLLDRKRHASFLEQKHD